MPDSGEGDLRAQLRELYRQAGQPTMDKLREHADLRGHSVSRSALATVLTGKQAMRWPTVAAFVDACAGYASRRRLPLPPGMTDLTVWRQLFDRVSPERHSRQHPEMVAGLAYRELLQADIAPDRLVDRERELAELVAFCAGEEPYWWWQAGPWAGKTALLSWFALHTPSGVDVVSFFVTGGLAGQSDSDAAIDAVINQLAAIAGERIDPTWAAQTRRGHLSRLLKNAAARCVAADRRLLLIVDGLDEDTSKRGGALRDSVASLLPCHPPSGVRVLLASRPEPDLPLDVRDGHPLKRLVPRSLSPSPHASDVERLAKAELKRVLDGPPLQREILGLLAACGGGLTLTDLELLTRRPPYELESEFDSVFGRSLTRRHLFGERVHLFAHDTLREIAVESFGTSLADYRNRLHEWALSYQHHDWPSDTPKYLVYGYPKLLADTADVARLTRLAIDPDRRQRVRELTGGDALALFEITAAARLVTRSPRPDLGTLLRLALARGVITSRNAMLCPELPIAWATLGEHDKASALVHSVNVPDRRAYILRQMIATLHVSSDHPWYADLQAATYAIPEVRPHFSDGGRAEPLANLALVLARAGHHERANRAASDAARNCHEYFEYNDHDAVSGLLLKVAVANGDLKRVMRLERSMYGRGRAEALLEIAAMLAAAGDSVHARELTDEATAAMGHASDSDHVSHAMKVIGVAAAAGEQDWFAELVTEAETAASYGYPHDRAKWLTALAKMFAATGNRDRALELAHAAEPHIAAIYLDRWRADRYRELVTVAATIRDRDYYRELAAKAETAAGLDCAARLCELAIAVADAGDRGRARRLALAAEAAAREEQQQQGDYELDDDFLTTILPEAATALTVAGDHDRAVTLADVLADDIRVKVLTTIAMSLVTAGERDRAVELTTAAHAELDHTYNRAESLCAVAGAFAISGNREQYVANIDKAEEAARAQWKPDQPHLVASSLAGVAVTAAAAGDYGRALALVGNAVDLIDYPTHVNGRLNGHELIKAVQAVAMTGDHDGAQRLAGELPNWYGARYVALATVVRELILAGDHDRAELLARTLHQSHVDYSTNRALAETAAMLAAAGHHHRAVELAASAEESARILDSNEFDSGQARGELASILSGSATHDREISAMTRRLLVEAINSSDWHCALIGVARLFPDGLAQFCDDLLLLIERERRPEH